MSVIRAGEIFDGEGFPRGGAVHGKRALRRGRRSRRERGRRRRGLLRHPRFGRSAFPRQRGSGYQRRQARGSSRHGGLRGVARRHGDVPCDYDAVRGDPHRGRPRCGGFRARRAQKPISWASTWRVRSSRPPRWARKTPTTCAIPASRSSVVCRRRPAACSRSSTSHRGPRRRVHRTAFGRGAHLARAHLRRLRHRGACLQARRAAPDASVNAMNSMHHRKPGPIPAAAERDDVTAEIIADGVHPSRHGAPCVQHVRRRSHDPHLDTLRAAGLGTARTIWAGRTSP